MVQTLPFLAKQVQKNELKNFFFDKFQPMQKSTKKFQCQPRKTSSPLVHCFVEKCCQTTLHEEL